MSAPTATDAIAIDEREPWLPLVVVSLSGLLTTFNLASAMTTMRAVVEGLSTTVSSVEVALVAYGTLVAAFGADGARISSIIGVVRTQLIGLGFYIAGMLVAGFALSVSALVLGQALAGVGGALLVANGTAILGQAYSGRQRTFAVSLQPGLMGLGASLGLLLGGLLSSYVNWRAPFLALATLLLVTFLLARRMEVAHRARSRDRRIDVASVVLVAAGILVLVGAVNQIGPWGLLSARPGTPSILGLSPVIFLIFGGGVLLKIFVQRQRDLRSAARAPLLAPEVAVSETARACLRIILSLSAVLGGLSFLLLGYSEIVLGHSAIDSSLFVLPIVMAMLVGAVAAPPLARRWSAKRALAGAIVLSACGIFLLSTVVSNDTYGVALWISEMLIGVGLGIGVALPEDLILATVPETFYGDAGSARGVSSFLGSALGTAISGAVLLSSLASSLGAALTAHLAERPDLRLPSAVALVPTKVSFVSNEALRTAFAEPPWSLGPAQIDVAVQLNVDARLAALRVSIAMMGLIMLSALLGVWALPPSPREEKVEPAIDGPSAARGAGARCATLT